MKNRVCLGFIFMVMVFHSGYSPAQVGKQKSANSSLKFIGTWKGDEKCKGVSIPVVMITVSGGSGNTVYLSGIYSITGRIEGTVKGDTVYIPLQEVKDPNFTNIHIEGKLAYISNPAALAGTIKIQNNQQPDECMVKYRK